MRLTRKPVTIVAVVAGLVAGMVATAPAHAAATASPSQATAVAERVGSAGAYRNSSGAMVVTVTSAAQAATVRAAGAAPRYVEHSLTDLRSAVGALNAQTRIPGTAWAINPVSNQVEVTYDSTVSAAELRRLTAVTGRFGDAVSVTRSYGTLSKLIDGGHPIYGGRSRCSLGFNVRNSAGTRYFITAGHCTDIAYYWYANSSHTTYLGNRRHSSFPGNDYGIVRYRSSISKPGVVHLYNGRHRDITRAGRAYVGQYVARSGSTTGVHRGYVRALNATVTYPQGRVYGLIRTNVCAEGGDSGGPLFAGNTALGLTSGGSGNCYWGGTTYFQPVPEVQNRYGVRVY